MLIVDILLLVPCLLALPQLGHIEHTERANPQPQSPISVPLHDEDFDASLGCGRWLARNRKVGAWECAMCCPCLAVQITFAIVASVVCCPYNTFVCRTRFVDGADFNDINVFKNGVGSINVFKNGVGSINGFKNGGDNIDGFKIGVGNIDDGVDGNNDSGFNIVENRYSAENR